MYDLLSLLRKKLHHKRQVPTLDSYNSICARLCSHVSNSWALVYFHAGRLLHLAGCVLVYWM